MKFRKKTLLAKLEVTYGLDSAPTGALNAILTKDLEINPLEGEVLERGLDKETLGADLGTLVGKHVKLTFKVEIAGSGAAGSAPAYGPLLVASGHQQTLNVGVSAVYVPIDEAASVTLHMKHDKILHTITGSRGKVRLVTKERQYAYFEFEFIGLFNPPTASLASLSPVLTAFQKPVPFRAANVECELFSQLVCLRELMMDFGQSNSFFECSEAESIDLEDRLGKFDIKFLEPELATHDFYDDINSDTDGELSYIHGTVAGNIVEVVAHHAQITKPGREKQQGNIVMTGSGPIARVGANEYTITVR